MKIYSDRRLARVNSDKTKSVDISVGTEVYYPTKKLSNKAEGYSSKLARRYSGPAIVKRIVEPMIVELTDQSGKIIGKYYITDLKIPRRSLRIK